MEKITLDTTMKSLEQLPELRGLGPYLNYNAAKLVPGYEEMTIAGAGKLGWNAKSILSGLHFLIRQLNGGAKPCFVYSQAECEEDPQKRDVNILRLMPGRPDPEKPYILLAAGGAFEAVCSAVEAYPVAEHMVNGGYQVFVLTYRTGGSGTLPKALEDMAAAWRFIHNASEEFQLRPDRYAVGGFSAGATLACCWGTGNVGYRAYGVPGPRAVFAAYPCLDPKSLPDKEAAEGLLHTMLGEACSEKTRNAYDVLLTATGGYPPCYLVCGKDDAVVPWEHSRRLKERLDVLDVPCILEVGEHAPHSFGDGRDTDVEGWPYRALAFLKKEEKRIKEV